MSLLRAYKVTTCLSLAWQPVCQDGRRNTAHLDHPITSRAGRSKSHHLQLHLVLYATRLAPAAHSAHSPSPSPLPLHLHMRCKSRFDCAEIHSSQHVLSIEIQACLFSIVIIKGKKGLTACHAEPLDSLPPAKKRSEALRSQSWVSKKK